MSMMKLGYLLSVIGKKKLNIKLLVVSCIYSLNICNIRLPNCIIFTAYDHNLCFVLIDPLCWEKIQIGKLCLTITVQGEKNPNIKKI